MKLHTRLVVLVSVLIASTALSVGSIAIISAAANQTKNYDQTINGVIEEVSTSKENAISLSTYLAEITTPKFAIAYITEELDLIPIYDDTYQLGVAPILTEIIKATKSPINLQEFRVQAYEFGNNEYLLFYYSLKDINETKRENASFLLIFTFLIIFIATLISFLVFRKDSQLNESILSIQRNRERMQEFIGDASHELRTPLTVIKGYFQLLFKTSTPTDESNKYYSRIDQEIERMQKIIEDLLLIAELDEGPSTTIENSDFSNRLILQIESLLDLQPGRKISHNVQPNIKVQIEPAYLEQLLANIFSNIKRYTPSDSLVEVTLAKKGNKSYLEINDSGPGLPQQFYKQGIQAFTRFDKGRSREKGGSGLGMSIIEKIISKNSGSITLSPSKFGGLSMLITFPAK